jgi:hypothetical protein
MHFTVKPCGSEAGSVHIAPILIAPESGSRNVSRSPGFTWIGFPDTTKYEFILAKDSTLTQIIVKEETSDAAYYYERKLDWGKNYFWRVIALEPVLSEPSAVSTFTVIPKPQPTPPTNQATPLWIWVTIGILTTLNVIAIVHCVIRR